MAVNQHTETGSVADNVTAFSAGKASANANYSIVIGSGDTSDSTVVYQGATNGIAIGKNAAVGAQNSQSASDGVALGASAKVTASYSVALGSGTQVTGQNSVALGHAAETSAVNSVAVGDSASVTNGGSVAVGKNASVNAQDGVALGYKAKVTMSNSVALGYGSVANTSDVVSVGRGGESGSGPVTRKIINVTAGTSDTDAVNVGQLNAAIASVQGADLSNYYTKIETDGTFATKDYVNTTFVKIKQDENNEKKNTTEIGGFVVENTDGVTKVTVTGVGSNPVEISSDGITVGDNSTHMDEEGFYACPDGDHTYDGANAAMMKDGRIKGAGGAFTVDAIGNVTATNLYTKSDLYNKTEVDTKLDGKADVADVYKKTETYSQSEVDTKLNDKADKATTLAGYGITDAYTIAQVDALLSNNNADAIAGINQRLEKTNAKINKVGAGAAALAALHPLEYDPDDKLTFSAGMGNYAGENAAALGAFYRPNEKFMVSLGGTMGNGENMVNLGLSIGLDKPNGYAKLSKRELIQEVNAVKAENAAMKDQLANADERIAKLEALVAQLVNK